MATIAQYTVKQAERLWMGENGKVYINGGPVNPFHGMSMREMGFTLKIGDTVMFYIRSGEVAKVIRNGLPVLEFGVNH